MVIPKSSRPTLRGSSLHRLALVFPALLAMGCDASPSPEDAEDAGASTQDLEDRIRTQLDALDARTSFYAKHLPTGREVAIRADEPMNTMSTIKIPAMVLAYRDAEEQRLDLDARHEVRPAVLRRGTGLLQTFDAGLSPTVRDLITQMIITSDNTATDIVLDRVGLERVNAFLEDEGYEETRFRMITGDFFREIWIQVDSGHADLSHREVYEKGLPAGPDAQDHFFEMEGDSVRWLGRSTAREMGRLLEGIREASLASSESSEEMMGILERQLYSSRLPRYLLGRARVAHKTGDWAPIAGSDVGILLYDGGPAVVAAYTGQNRGDFTDLERTLGRIAEALVDSWS